VIVLALVQRSSYQLGEERVLFFLRVLRPLRIFRLMRMIKIEVSAAITLVVFCWHLSAGALTKVKDDHT